MVLRCVDATYARKETFCNQLASSAEPSAPHLPKTGHLQPVRVKIIGVLHYLGVLGGKTI